MRGLKRLTYFANRLQAQADWSQLASYVKDNGAEDLVEMYEPKATASIKQIDQAIADLRQAYMARACINPYVLPTD